MMHHQLPYDLYHWFETEYLDLFLPLYGKPTTIPTCRVLEYFARRGYVDCLLELLEQKRKLIAAKLLDLYLELVIAVLCKYNWNADMLLARFPDAVVHQTKWKVIYDREPFDLEQQWKILGEAVLFKLVRSGRMDLLEQSRDLFQKHRDLFDNLLTISNRSTAEWLLNFEPQWCPQRWSLGYCTEVTELLTQRFPLFDWAHKAQISPRGEISIEKLEWISSKGYVPHPVMVVRHIDTLRWYETKYGTVKKGSWKYVQVPDWEVMLRLSKTDREIGELMIYSATFGRIDTVKWVLQTVPEAIQYIPRLTHDRTSPWSFGLSRDQHLSAAEELFEDIVSSHDQVYCFDLLGATQDTELHGLLE